MKKLIDTIRIKYPKIPITFISIEQSHSREKYIPQMKEANQMIVEMLKGKAYRFYQYCRRLYTADGRIMSDIFLKNNLHMNAKGYVIWQKIMGPYLK